MAEGKGAAPPPDVQAMARDWITIWQSELSAMATDRELQESWVKWVTFWAEAAERATRLLPAGPHDPAGCAGAAAPAGAAPAMAAPGDRDAAIQRLEQRIAELERRLASRATGPGDGAAGS